MAAQEQSRGKPWTLMVWDVGGEVGQPETIAVPERPWTLQGWWPDGRLLIVARRGWASRGGAGSVQQNGQIALLDPDTGKIETLLETGNRRGALWVAGGG